LHLSLFIKFPSSQPYPELTIPSPQGR